MARKSSNHVLKRGKQYYLRLAIPPSIRKHFPSGTGEPRVNIIERLGTDSPSEAEIRALRRAATYREVFKRLRDGEEMTREQIEAALQRDKAREIAASRIVPIWQAYEAAVKEIDSQAHEAASKEPGRVLPAPKTWAAKLEVLAAERRKKLGAAAIELGEMWEAAQTEASGMLDEAHSAKELARITTRYPHLMTGESQASETIGQAAEAWYAQMQADKSAAVKETTLDGHRLRVRAFIQHAGDIPLANVTRAKASDFLASLKVANRTRNAYATTLASVFKNAKHRGRFAGENPFEDMKAKAGGSSYADFTAAELQALFTNLPRDIAPDRHSPETALPWVALIAAYTGARLEEIAQLKTTDIRTEGINGSSITVIDIHNGGNNHLKNESSARLVPVHSQLVRHGLLDYVKALPEGPLFPGLTRRLSKGGKIGARIGELFRKKLVALGIKREGLCFHSFRHLVATRLETAGVSQTDAARVLGHTIEGMSYGTYSSGPGLARLKATVEDLRYDDVTAIVR